MPEEMNQQSMQQPVQQPTPQQQIPTGQSVPQQIPTAAGTSGLAVAGLVLGILAFLLSFIPLMNLGSIIMGLLGLVLAIAGLISTRGGKHKGKGLAIAGIALSLLALIVTFAMYGTAAAISEENKSSYATTTQEEPADAQQESSSAQEEATEQSTEEAAEAAAEEPTEAVAEETAPADYVVNIEGARLGQDYEGKDVAIVTYSWQNNSDGSNSFWLVFSPKVFQNSVETEIGIAMDIDNDGYMAEVKPGGGTTFEIAYEIKDRSDITVEVSPLFDWSGEVITEQTFTLE